MPKIALRAVIGGDNVGKTSVSVKSDSPDTISVNKTLVFCGAISAIDPERVRALPCDSCWLLFLAAPFCSAHSSQLAEKRIFIIANSPDAYGVDRCLADGACLRSRGRGGLLPSEGVSDGGVLPQGRTATRSPAQLPAAAACGRNGCDEFVAIECTALMLQRSLKFHRVMLAKRPAPLPWKGADAADRYRSIPPLAFSGS